ncbi:MAG: glycoside hydrolase family 97 protein [Bryobacteraceae bacterium]
MLRALLILTLFACILGHSAASTLTSPDGNLKFEINTPSGQLSYSVSFQGKAVIEQSALRLQLQDQRPLGTGMTIVSQNPSQGVDEYKLLAGKRSEVYDRYNALSINAEEAGPRGRRLQIQARAYNDGIAFRYVILSQPALREYRLTKEATEFRLSRDAVTYALLLPNYRTSYESEYLKVNASYFSGKAGLGQATLIGLPYLMHLNGIGWLAITEADLRNNAAMYLAGTGQGWGEHQFESRISVGDEPEVLVRGTLPHTSAWRVLLIGDHPGRLIESTLLTSLNPPSKISDVSWIHAGLAAWDWWSGSLDPDGNSSFTTENMKTYVDFAAQSKFPYTLVDAGWAKPHDITEMNGKIDIPVLVQYARGKHVKIWIWLHHDDVARQMEEAFPLYETWGVAGVKVDFIERDDQVGIDFYYRVAEQAAQHHLMVDFHGATKPWGIERTYPNVLGYEAVLGMEQSKAGGRDNPDHRATLPFTRMLGGLMDYTPGGFSNVTEDDFVPRGKRPLVMGTRAQQLAMYAIYEAPIQMVSDSPKSYRDQPSFEFIEHAPATWDDTRVLSGEPGEYIVMARRSGKEWFVGSLTNRRGREIDVPLEFLGPGKYQAQIFADAPDADRYPKNVAITRRAVDQTTHLKAKLASGGGYAVRIVPVP